MFCENWGPKIPQNSRNYGNQFFGQNFVGHTVVSTAVTDNSRLIKQRLAGERVLFGLET